MFLYDAFNYVGYVFQLYPLGADLSRSSFVSSNATSVTDMPATDTPDMLEINKTRSTAYHPEGNGQIENLHKTLKSMLKAKVGHC